MRKLEIGTEKFTRVYAEDEKEFNANHVYLVVTAPKPKVVPSDESEEVILQRVRFQKGPIGENGVNGLANEDLLVMVIDRLNSFQESQYKCKENACAITKLEEAILWLRKRTQDRERRNVEGTSKI